MVVFPKIEKDNINSKIKNLKLIIFMKSPPEISLVYIFYAINLILTIKNI